MLDVVIVTYNRLEKLKHTLSLYELQTYTPRSVIVVNNCSTDGTSEFLKQWELEKSNFEKVVINTKENLGGSGGFYIGQEFALTRNPDWIFIADDDAYPFLDMIEKFYKFIEKYDSNKVSAICSSVLYSNGDICFNHRGWHKVGNTSIERIDSHEDDYKKSFFEIDLLSYVGAYINVEALKKVGLVNPKYFIYYDDTEHSLRLKKYGSILCVPSIKINHDCTSDSTDDVLIDWRDFYAIRNKTNMILKHYPQYGLKILWRNRGTLLKKQTDNVKKMRKCALWSALLNRLGKHHLYKPGWSIKNNK